LVIALGSASADRITIDARFNGPPTSANGGCACGVAARLIQGPAAPVEVALRAPVPLGTGLDVERAGKLVTLRHGDVVVAEARLARAPDVEPPVRPTVADARAAMDRPWGNRPEVFAGCWVCSPTRDDGLGVAFGRVPGHDGVTAALVRTGVGIPQADGRLAPEVAWGALDCVSYAPHLWELDRPSLLAGMTTELLEPVPAGAPAVAVGWSLHSDGRKHHTASALLGADGRLLGRARALWITLRG
jgi:hypothetical protein